MGCQMKHCYNHSNAYIYCLGSFKKLINIIPLSAFEGIVSLKPHIVRVLFHADVKIRHIYPKKKKKQ